MLKNQRLDKSFLQVYKGFFGFGSKKIRFGINYYKISFW